MAIEKADLKEKYALFEKGYLTKQRILDLISYHNFDNKEIAKEFVFIESISDIEIKKKYLT